MVTDLDDLQATISSLIVEQSYTFRVLAYNHNGDGAGNETTLTPTSTDTSVPRLLTARLDTYDSRVLLTYNEPLDESSVPPDTAFTVSLNGTNHTSSVEVRDSVVTLTTSGSRSPTDVLTVRYSAPTGADAQPLKDSAGNQAADFAAEAVRNDRTQVTFSSDPGPDNTYSWNGGSGGEDVIEVTVTFSEAVRTGGTTELGLLIGSKTRQAAYHSGSGTSSLVFRHLVTEGDRDDDGIEVVRAPIDGLVRYVSTKAVAPAGVELGPDSGHLVDAVRPVLLTAGVLAGQSDLTLTWDKALDEASVTHHGDASFYIWDRTAKEQLVPSMITILGRRVTLTLREAVASTDDFVVSVRPPPRGSLQDTVGNHAASVSAFPVRVVQQPNNPPEFLSSESGARSVDENTPAGRNIGDPITATDADRLTYSISGTDADFFEVIATSGQLRTKESLDRETRSSYSFTLSVTDGKDTLGFADAAIDDTIDVTITVNDVDEPAIISFTAASAVTATNNDLAVEENHAGPVATFSANDPERKASLSHTWSLAGIDAADFNISQTGVLTFAAAPDYERPADSGGNNLYDITVNALDSDGLTGHISVSVMVRPVNEPPTISGEASPSIEEEGAMLVGTYQVRDPENATIAWQPIGGTDSDRFEFTASSGRLAFKSAPDYEDATDSGRDNVYDMSLSASAGGHTETLNVAVSVTNKEEPGSLILSSLQPQAEADFTATLSDPDIVQSTNWTWERSTSTGGSCPAVSGATSDAMMSVYRPGTNDDGYYLKVTVSYTDGHGPGKCLIQRSSRAVLAERGSNNPPSFDSSSTTREVAENSRANTAVGAPVTAMDVDPGDVLTYNLSGSSLFTIDRSSGQIRVAEGASVDHESGPSHTVTVTVSDSSNASDEISVTINVTDVNEPPEAGDDAQTTFEDEPVTFSVLSNDRDPENDALSVTLNRTPSNGTASVDQSTFEITYRPRPDYHGSDTLTYTLQDEHGLRDVGSVAISVVTVNDPPKFPEGPHAREVARSAEAGDEIGKPVVAVDVDGDRLRYELSGPNASLFEIDEGNGQITLRDEISGEVAAQAEYTVTVEVFDEDLARAEADVTITVVEKIQPPKIGVGGGGGGGPPPVPIPSDQDFDWNVTRDIESLDRENELPTGIWSNGTVLWVVENAATGADRLFAYNPQTGNRVPEHDFELDRRNRFSHGIWSNGEVVWIADSGQDRLFAYTLATGERLEERDLDLDERNKDPRGIWSDGKTIYVLDSVRDALFAYDLETGEVLAEYPLDKLNRSPRGIWSDGVNLWISDDGAKRIFAYRVVDNELERIEDEEFTFRSLLKAGNGNPRGIWSDGDIMFVVDEQDDRVYTYNIPDKTIALLGSLSLTGLEIGMFAHNLRRYSATAEQELELTTVAAMATQEQATVVIEPDDADDDPSNGHQVALDDETTIAVRVTSIDRSRVNTYEITVRKPPCLTGLGETRLSDVTFSGGSLEALARCARSQAVAAFFYRSDDSWLFFAPDLPDFLSHQFRRHFEAGVPVGTALIAAKPSESGAQN